MADCKKNEYAIFEGQKMVCKECPVISARELTHYDGSMEEKLIKLINEKKTSNNPEISETYGELYSHWQQCTDIARDAGMSLGEIQLERESANKRHQTLSINTWEVLQDFNPNIDCSGSNIERLLREERGHVENEIRICEILNLYLQSDGFLERGYLDTMIKQKFGTPKDISQGEFDYELSESELKRIKNEIHDGRGSYVTDEIWTWILKKKQEDQTLPRATWDDKRPGSDHIIIEEFYDYTLHKNLEKKKPSGIDAIDFKDLFSHSNADFEMCMNDMFDSKMNVGGGYDIRIQTEINKLSSIVDLTPEQINYIEDKLRTIRHIQPKEAVNCMKLLNICETMVNNSIADKMLRMGYLVFHIVGLDNMHLENIDPGSIEYYRLKQLLDRLTPHIRDAVKNILNISSYYEINMCGYQSTTTHVLEVIYKDIFEKSKEVSIYFDAADIIPDYLIKDTTIMEFVRAVILMVVAICAVYVLLMVLNRPPYPVPSK